MEHIGVLAKLTGDSSFQMRQLGPTRHQGESLQLVWDARSVSTRTYSN